MIKGILNHLYKVSIGTLVRAGHLLEGKGQELIGEALSPEPPQAPTCSCLLANGDTVRAQEHPTPLFLYLIHRC